MKFHRLAFTAVLLALGTLSNNVFVVRGEDDVPDDIPVSSTTTPVDYTPPDGAENFQFEAEVHRMLDIVVNSLYQNKDVFLRELISNASDALDKIRFLGLTDPDMLKDKEELEVRIEFDKDAKTLTIRDSGIGMTRDDLVSHLGTVARSGTTKFLEALAEKDKTSDDVAGMIGKFGVGFYSSFLVSDRVTVASKHPSSDKQYIWESINGESSYHIYEDPRGSSLGRGTEITLHLKDDCLNYAEEAKVEELVTHYSEFVNHPIHMRTVTVTEVEVDSDEEEEDADKDEDAEKSEDEEETEEEEKPKKTEEVTTFEWKEINSNVAIWTREKDSISDDEYKSFWKVLSKEDHTDAARWTHFNAEGNINFKSILYLPDDIPDHYRFGNVDAVKGGLKLYVRKVLISDQFELMPRYLGFVRGVVDSDDLPLNVNRETLQESKIIKVIKKKLVRKAIDLMRAFSKEAPPEDDDDEEKEVEVDDEGNVVKEEPKTPKEAPYIKWYEKFNSNIKMGILDDEPNRGKLAKLLRFKSSKTTDDKKYVSLEEYVENMKEWQKEIYVLAGQSVEEVEKSPFLETFKEKDVEVLYLTDPVDEYMLQQMRDFDGKKFQPISSETVKLEDEDKDLVKRRAKAYKKKFMPLTKWLKKLYGMNVMRVAISKRLGSAPAIVSSSEYGHSANMERIMRAQAYQHGQSEFTMRAMKILEINPRHPFIHKLLDGCPPDGEEETFEVSEEIEDSAWMLLDMACLSGGFPVVDGGKHSERVNKYLQSALGVDTMDLEDEIDPPEDEEDDDEPDMDEMPGLDGLNMGDFDTNDLDLDLDE